MTWLRLSLVETVINHSLLENDPSIEDFCQLYTFDDWRVIICSECDQPVLNKPASLLFMILAVCCAPWLRYCTSPSLPCLLYNAKLPHTSRCIHGIIGIPVLVKSKRSYPKCLQPAGSIQKFFQIIKRCRCPNRNHCKRTYWRRCPNRNHAMRTGGTALSACGWRDQSLSPLECGQCKTPYGEDAQSGHCTGWNIVNRSYPSSVQTPLELANLNLHTSPASEKPPAACCWWLHRSLGAAQLSWSEDPLGPDDPCAKIKRYPWCCVFHLRIQGRYRCGRTWFAKVLSTNSEIFGSQNIR